MAQTTNREMKMKIKNKISRELEDLNIKIYNLEAFIGGDNKYGTLSKIQISLLAVQLNAMTTYATCLYERLNNL